MYIENDEVNDHCMDVVHHVYFMKVVKIEKVPVVDLIHQKNHKVVLFVEN